MTPYILHLGDRRAFDRTLTGGKGATLAKLTSLGFKVPDGIIITSSVLSDLLVHTDLLREVQECLRAVDPWDTRSLRDASSAARSTIEGVSLSKDFLRDLSAGLDRLPSELVAVRSSASFEDSSDRSWAGQFDSFLNVRKADIPDRIKECWSSAFSFRALSYGLPTLADVDSLSFAVIIQEMVESDIAGVMFTVDPSDTTSGNIYIEAARGYGDSVVSGATATLSIAAAKGNGRIMKQLGDHEDSFVSEAHVESLAAAARALESQLKAPLDVEWAIQGSELWILQARPITAKIVPSSTPRLEDYELTFKVSGLSFLFADMLARAFGYLDPLFTSDHAGVFRQYFSRVKMGWAAETGVRWFGEKDSFVQYQHEFEEYHRQSTSELQEILMRSVLGGVEVERFFGLLSGYLNRYSRMDNQFTDLAFKKRGESSTASNNLDRLSRFKDVARVWINDTMLVESSFYGRMCNRLASETRVQRESLEVYTVKELARMKEDGIQISEKVVQGRQLAYVVFFRDEEPVYLSEQEASAFIAAGDVDSESIGNVVRGQVANRPKHRVVDGKIRVIDVDYSNLSEVDQAIQEMKEGEILVASFTAPELLTACKKAKAIVTDIGGMLSHAAIVSRELGLPCLVGTQHATKLLGNGDRVRIDFDVGTCTKL